MLPYRWRIQAVIEVIIMIEREVVIVRDKEEDYVLLDPRQEMRVLVVVAVTVLRVIIVVRCRAKLGSIGCGSSVGGRVKIVVVTVSRSRF